MVRAATKADDVVDVAKSTDIVGDVVEAVDDVADDVYDAFKNYGGNNPGKTTILGYKEDIEVFAKGLDKDFNYLLDFEKWSDTFNKKWLKDVVDSGNPIAIISDKMKYAKRFLHQELKWLDDWGADFVNLFD